ncbi:MAG: hypothetical protein ABIR28_09515 [Vicinamibacteria bacterium]
MIQRTAFLACFLVGAPLFVAAQPATPLGTRVVTSDGVIEFLTHPESGTVTVRDLLNQTALSESLVCPDPRGAALTLDEVSLIVVCRGADEVAFLNTAAFDVVARVRGLGAKPESAEVSRDGTAALVRDHDGRLLGTIDLKTKRLAAIAPSVPATAKSGRRNQLVFMGMIHGVHRTSKSYSTRVVKDLIAVIRPDYVLTEIPPNRLDRAALEFKTTSQIAEPRVSRFPEYVDVLFSLQTQIPFVIVGTAGWTQPMDRYRRERLAAIERDPKRAADWAEYQAAIKASDDALAKGGAADDPRWIHSDAYDGAQRVQLDVYNRLFDKELGPGGWDTINRTHFANITRTLDEHSGEGLRFLVTYGAGHKSWMLPKLRERKDLEILEASPFLDRLAK